MSVQHFAIIRLSIVWSILFFSGRAVTANNAPSPSRMEMISRADMVTIPAEALPLPVIPSTLRGPRARAAYLLQHFWDSMDFEDTLRSHNRDFIERHLVNFISLLPHADTVAVVSAVQTMFRRAECDRGAWLLLAEVAEKYLYETGSPLFDEGYYLLFLEEMTGSAVADASEGARFNYQLRMLRKNRPGTRAADFGYVDRKGRPHTLYRTRCNLQLLLFYDPDCDHCEEMISALHGSALLRELIGDKQMNVLAVYAEGDRQAWEASKSSMPQEWSVGFDIDGIWERNLYFLPSMPGLYLLDGEKYVLLKNPSLPVLEAFLRDRFHREAAKK